MKHYSIYTVNLAWLKSSTREPWWLQYLKFAFSQNANCDNSVGFPKSIKSHIYNIIIITSISDIQPSTAVANQLPGQLVSTEIS